MGDDEVEGFRRVGRAGSRGPLHPDAGPPEQEQVEVELAGPPAGAVATAERPLEPLQGDEQGERAGRGVGAGRDVERHDRVAELRLVGHADGFGDVEARDPGQSHAGQGREGANRRGEGRGGVSDVRPEADVGPDAPAQRRTSAR